MNSSRVPRQPNPIDSTLHDAAARVAAEAQVKVAEAKALVAHGFGAQCIAKAEPPPPPSPATQKLNKLLSECQGPYMINGKQLRVPSRFRMNEQSPAELVQAQNKIRAQLATGGMTTLSPAMQQAINLCTVGKGSPEQLRMVTQALINTQNLDTESKVKAEIAAKQQEDRKALERGETLTMITPTNTAELVMRLMETYNLGLDCSGLAHYAQKALGNDLGDPGNSRMQLGGPVPPLTELKAGDSLILSKDPDGYEHKVTLMDAQPLRGGECYADIRAFASDKDKVFRWEVLASWGGGRQATANSGSFRGVEKRTWLYNATTKQFAVVSPTTHPPTVIPVEGGGLPDRHPTIRGVVRPGA